jgi:hypothetical protein
MRDALDYQSAAIVRQEQIGSTSQGPTFHLPDRLTAAVKGKNPRGSMPMFLDFQLNLAELNGLVAQRAELAGSVTGPHPGPCT